MLEDDQHDDPQWWSQRIVVCGDFPPTYLSPPADEKEKDDDRYGRQCPSPVGRDVHAIVETQSRPGTKVPSIHERIFTRGSGPRFVKISNDPNTNSECSNLLN